MIYPRQEQRPQQVAEHYDDLDPWYLRIWGEHVHHGLWETGAETSEQAVRRLVEHVAERTAIVPGTSVCDIGCGYGGTLRMLAARGARGVGYTLSRAQYEYALSRSANGAITVHLGDWLQNTLSDGCMDVALSIESSEHMPDKEAFFAEAWRVLRPGGRMAVCAWTAADRPGPLAVTYLLEPICREGRLPGLGNESDYRRWFKDAGFIDIVADDLTRKVRKTWAICAGRMLKAFARDPEARRFLLKGPEDRVFVKTVFRIWSAYWTGSMRYLLFTARKPQ